MSAAPADNLKPGQVILVAGTGERGYSGDGWAAREARIGDVVTVTVAPDGVSANSFSPPRDLALDPHC